MNLSFHQRGLIMAVSISNIPRKWDVVSDVQYLDNNTKARIIFNTGATITVKVALSDSSRDPTPIPVHTKPVKPKIKIIKNEIKKAPKIITPEMQQEAYRQQAMQALREMGGSTESLKAAMMTPLVDPNYEIMKQRALMESQSKSEQLVNELTPMVPGDIKIDSVNDGVSDRFYFEKQA